MLIREPNNVHDHNAIIVVRMVLNEERGIAEVCDDLGHISRELAEELSVRIDGGEAFIAKISAITGDLEVDTDGDDGYNAGVNLRIYKLKDESALARTVLTARI